MPLVRARGRRYGASAGNASTGSRVRSSGNVVEAGTWSRPLENARAPRRAPRRAVARCCRPSCAPSRARFALAARVRRVVVAAPLSRRTCRRSGTTGCGTEPEAPRGGRRRRHPCSAATQRRVHEPAPATRGARVELVVVVVRRRSRTCRSPSTITRVEEEPGPNTRWWTLPTTTSADEERYTKNREEEPGGDGAGVLPGRRSTRSEQPRGPPSAAMQIGSQKPQKKGAITTA